MLGEPFQKLGEMLLKEGKISDQQLDDGLRKQQNESGKLGELLVDLKVIDEQEMINVLSRQIQIPAATGRMLEEADVEWVRHVPEPFAKEHGVLPLGKKDGQLLVAMIDPENLNLVDHLGKLTNCAIEPYLAGREMLKAAVEKWYESVSASGQMQDVVSDLEFSLDEKQVDEQIDLSSIGEGADEAPIVKLVNIILTNAVRDRATDIHIEPRGSQLIVRYRVDGALVLSNTLPMKSHSGVVARLKVMSKLNIAESRLPQDGRFTLKFSGKSIDVRVSILPSVLGEKIVMRLLDQGSFDLSLARLGMDEANLKLFTKAINLPYGIVIITGPTGAGKSTTLYAALQAIKSEEDNIITVEDPVEYQLEGITQVATNDKIDLSFARVLRSILRQDPDKLLIGEIRDRETADIAMKFALTGHLVFTTLHANDTASTITRLIDIGVAPFLVGSSVVLVMAQRLIRTVCPQCKEEHKPDPLQLELLQIPQDLHIPTFYQGKGCQKCRYTGYFGRTGIFEVMPIQSQIRKIIFDGADQEKVRSAAMQNGMVTLRKSALHKLQEGVTSVREVLKHTVEEF